MAEKFADSKERRGCSYWSGLFTGFKSGYAAAPQKGMKITFDGPFDVGNGDTETVATLQGFPGMVVSGKTKQEAWYEMMKSIKVLIAYNSGIDSNELKALDESPSPSEAGDGWISVEQYLPGREDYYEVKFEDGTIDEKPFRIRYSKNILGFMTQSKVTHWRPLLPRQNKLLNTIK